MADISPEFDAWLVEKVRAVMGSGPTEPPYRVEVASESAGRFYVSGSACNAFGALSFDTREFAEVVAARANEIAKS